MNIPIYRAKKINSDEYVEGCFNIWEQNGKIYHSIMDIFEFPSPYSNIHVIDITTLAIHFSNMLDSQGSKIFASLSEDGKGGDIIHHKKPYCKDDRKYYEWNVKFDKRRITPFAEREYWNPSRVPLKDILTNPKAYIKVVGIQE